MKGTLTTLKPEDFKPIENAIFADTETDGLGGKLLAVGYVGLEDDRVVISPTLSELFNYVFHSNAGIEKIYFHNLEYDGRYIQEELMKRKIDFEVVNRGTRVLVIKIGHFVNDKFKSDIEFIDTLALLSESLKSLSNVFAPEYAKLYMDFNNITFDINNPEHRRYLEIDCIGLKYVYIRFREMVYQYFGVNAGYTASSTALKAWQILIPKGEYHNKLHSKLDDFVRKSYFGGIVYCPKIEHYSNIICYDVNSMYPHIMRTTPMPFNRPTKCNSVNGVGFYHFNVDATEAKFLFINGYDDKGNKHAQMGGKFEAYITDMEYELGLKLGYKFEFIEGYYFQDVKNIFKNFVDKCEKLRLEHNKDAIGKVTKLIQNSLYGKFGTKKEKEVIRYLPNIDAELTLGFKDVLWNMQPSGLYLVPQELDVNYTLPHYASYITAGARCYLVSLIMEVGIENVVYCDTDSLFIKAEHRNKLDKYCGMEYGKLKVEAEMNWFITIAKKSYFSDKKSRAKGIPHKYIRDTFELLKAGKKPEIKYRALTSMKTAFVHKKEYYNDNATRTITLSDIPEHVTNFIQDKDVDYLLNS